MGSGPSAPASPLTRHHTNILTIDQETSKVDNRTMDSRDESEDDSPIPRLNTSAWSDEEDDDDLKDVDTLRRDLDSALESSPKRRAKTSAKSDASSKSKRSHDSRFLMDSVDDSVDRKDFPETYAQKIQRVKLEDQQPVLLVRDHVMVRRDPDDWELDEDQILDFDVTKFKAVNQTQTGCTNPLPIADSYNDSIPIMNILYHFASYFQTFITQSFASADVRSSTPKSPANVEYDPFEEEIMAAIERDF